ncbi:MAG: outer membrane beta-barrel protein [Microbacter sp.]
MRTTIFTKLRYGICLIVVMVSGIWVSAAAPMGIVKGHIVDQKKQPVEFATAALLNAKTNQLVTGSVSNEKGEFVIEKVPMGEYKLAVSMMGYQKVETEPFVLAESNHGMVEKQIVLNEATHQLSEATVTARRMFIEQQADKLVVNPESSITTASDNVFDIIKKLPGVSVDNNDNISLKGKQGVMVFIDDKPTYLSADQLANLLKGMQGKDVERIEIIDNPSAKYDAEGNSGIINIKTKHNRAPGFNGTIFGGLAIGSRLGENGGIDLNLHTGKFNFYGNYSFYEWTGWQSMDAVRQFMSGSGAGNFQQIYTYSLYHGNAHNFKVGADYNINKHQVFSVMFRGSTGFNDMGGHTENMFADANHLVDSTLYTQLTINNHWQNYTYNANYKWDIDSLGQCLTVDADYAQFFYHADNHQSSYFLNGKGENLIHDFNMLGLQKSSINIFTAKVDYVYPVNKKVTVESGLKTSFVTNDATSDFNVNDPTGMIWNPALKLHDHFIYNENINAAYVSARGQYGKNSLQLGLRVENTNSKGNSESMNQIDSEHYTNLFPSLFVQHVFNDNNQLGFSYSYRIGRPNYQMLNPFIWMLDPYTFQKGNPFLQPQFTHAMALNYTYKNRWITSLGFNDTRDLFTQVLAQDDQTNVIYQTDENMSRSIDVNLSETAQLDMAKWWHVNATVIGMYKRVTTKVIGGEAFSRWSYNGNVSNAFTLANDWSAEVSGQYASKQLWGNFILQPQYQVNVGLQKRLLKNRMIVKVSVDDLFNTFKGGAVVKYNEINMNIVNRWDSRKLNVSLSYHFGTDNFKTRANRLTASSEEERRSAK